MEVKKYSVTDEKLFSSGYIDAFSNWFIANIKIFASHRNLQLTGRPGVLCLGEVSATGESPSTGQPNINSSSLESGGGIGYLPMAISTSDNPILHISDCTE